MALDVTQLGNDLAAALATLPPSKEDAAMAISQCYLDYAQNGTFGASVPVLDNTYRDAMAATLAAALGLPGLAATAAAAYAAAVTTFWAVVAVAGPQVGTSNGCPGASALTGAIAAVFANLANTYATCGAGMAAALHTATLTVTATVSPPPGTVVPIA